MRKNEKYIEKVADEMTVFQKHLLLGTELTPTQEETFKKIELARAYLNDGYSEEQIITVFKTDPSLKIQSRRAREIIQLAYSVFAELRAKRNKNGLKFIFEELYREKAQKIYETSMNLINKGDIDGASKLLPIYYKLIKEAGIIAGVYEKVSNVDDKRKPTKIIIRRKTTIKNDVVQNDEIEESAEFDDYELDE